MSLKTCRKCGKLIPYSEKYCNSCKISYEENRKKQLKEAKKKYDNNYNKKRDPKYKKFYNSKEWKILKEKYLQEHQYKCERCEELRKTNPKYKVRLAVEVHHLEWLSTENGWLRRLDYKNLKALCHKHHDEVHNRFQKNISNL